MLTPKTAAYGSWKSLIASDLVARSITLSKARFYGKDVYWLEGRSQELTDPARCPVVNSMRLV
jgi:hypothetical protein